MRKPVLKAAACMAAVVLFMTGAAPLSGAATGGKRKSPVKIERTLSVQDYRIGMTMIEVKKLLRRKKIRKFDTGFSDLFAYSPAPGAELRIFFSCAPKGYVVNSVELSLDYDAKEEAETTERYKDQLLVKYGPPATGSLQGGELDFCWGQCGASQNGTRLRATTSEEQERKARLTLLLENDTLPGECSALREKRINAWLDKWTAFAGKVRLGMTVDGASSVYAGMYRRVFTADEAPDENDEGIGATNVMVNDHEYFDDLDADSRNFEGEGPGAITLKFTGPQTGDKALDGRLYYCRLTTTKFRDISVGDLAKRLDQFISVYGKPTERETLEEHITARWNTEPIVRSLTISANGLIELEQSDFSLRDAYRKAVAGLAERNKNNKLKNNPF